MLGSTHGFACSCINYMKERVGSGRAHTISVANGASNERKSKTSGKDIDNNINPNAVAYHTTLDLFKNPFIVITANRGPPFFLNKKHICSFPMILFSMHARRALLNLKKTGNNITRM